MFVLTLNREAIKKVALTACCGVLLAGAVFMMNGKITGGEIKQTSTQPIAPTRIESTQDMASFFTAYGLEMDPASVTMDKVKVPRKWDESFSAFNAEIEKSGLSLEKYKGKTVEKWTMLCPSSSTGDQKSYGVLLLYKKDAVGAYILQKPSGEVTALPTASSTAAPLTDEEKQTQFAQPDPQLTAPTDQQPQTAPAEQPAQETSVDVPFTVNDSVMPIE